MPLVALLLVLGTAGGCRGELPPDPADPDTPSWSCDSLEASVNPRDATLMTEREVFVVSDADWRAVLGLVPVALWTTPDGSQRSHPVLIFHEEESAFDADAIIYFLRQYQPSRVTLVGTPPEGLEELLTSAEERNTDYDRCMAEAWWAWNPPGSANPNPDGERPNGYCGYSTLGGGVPELKRITTADYPSYWESPQDLVVVDRDDYKTGLMASVYASAVNALLLFVDDNSLDEVADLVPGSKVVTVGELDGETASWIGENAEQVESLSIAELELRFARGTGTDKVVLVNHRDFESDFSAPASTLYPELNDHDEPGAASVVPIEQLYRGLSLAAPLLAAARYELVLTPDVPKTQHLLARDNPNSSATCQDLEAVRTQCCGVEDPLSCIAGVDTQCSFGDNAAVDSFCTTLEAQWGLWDELTATIEGLRSFLAEEIARLELSPTTLTVVGGAYAIPHSIYSYDPDHRYRYYYTEYYSEVWGATWLARAVDPSAYADLDGDQLPDLAVGRLMGFTPADVSALVARSLFYGEVAPTASVAIAVNERTDWAVPRAGAQALSAGVEAAGFAFEQVDPIPDSYSIYGGDNYYFEEHFDGGSWQDRALLYHVSHGRRYWIGPWAYEIPPLTSTVVLSVGHNTLDTILDGGDERESTGMMAVRKGAAAVLGTVWVSRPLNPTYADTVDALMADDLTVGEAFRRSYRSAGPGVDIVHDPILVGDPALRIGPAVALSGLGDRDGDCLNDLFELHRGTDPDLCDSDGDGVCDGEDLAAGGVP
jgi:hypothetical protein